MNHHTHARPRALPPWLLVLATAACLVSACDEYFPDQPLIVPDEVTGLRPDYVSFEDARAITLRPGEDLGAGAPPIELADFTLVPAVGRGLTVRPKGPTPGGAPSALVVPGFLRVTSVRDNGLSLESYADRVTLRIDGLDRFTLISRERDRLAVDPYLLLRDARSSGDFGDIERPYDGSVFLQCVDTTAGYVRAWQAATLRRPQCRFR